MIVVDRETACAIYKCWLRTRFPKLASVRSVVRDCGVIELILSRARTLAGHEDLVAIVAYCQIERRVGATDIESPVNTDPLLRSITRVVSDRDVVELTRRGSRNSTNVDQAAIGTECDDITVIDAGWRSVPSL